MASRMPGDMASDAGGQEAWLTILGITGRGKREARGRGEHCWGSGGVVTHDRDQGAWLAGY